MACTHCGSLATTVSTVLCDPCLHKALQVLPVDPKERIHIYAILAKSDNFIIRMCAEHLLKMDADTIEEAILDPTDRMFNSRG